MSMVRSREKPPSPSSRSPFYNWPSLPPLHRLSWKGIPEGERPQISFSLRGRLDRPAVLDVRWVVLPKGEAGQPLGKELLYRALLDVTREVVKADFEARLSFFLHSGGTAASALIEKGALRRPPQTVVIQEGLAKGQWRAATAGANSCDPRVCLRGWVSVYTRDVIL